ncbi:SurA N-terminal domain-containing protein [Gemmobacter lanyuensis]
MSIGTVGDREIDANRYFRALRAEMNAMGQQLGTQIDLPAAQGLGIDARVRQSLVTTAALDNEAARIGLSMGDARVAQDIAGMDAFKGLRAALTRKPTSSR